MTCVMLLLASCRKDDYRIPVGSDTVPVMPAKVEVVKDSTGAWQMLVDGEPYYINGAACNAFNTKVAHFGGNTIRLYQSNGEGVRESLDEAYQAGLKVNLGLYLNVPSKTFDYSNPDHVAGQKAKLEEYVRLYRNHPALLCWSVGNETEADNEDNVDLFKAINEIAAMIHEMDPNHPTTVALAGSGETRVRNVKEYAPEIDILSVNSYAPNIPALLQNLKDVGWEKPYMVTEFGPRGTWQMNPEPSRILPWEITLASNGKKISALVEQTSTEKAEDYRSIWTDHIKANQRNGCLGSFVFVWGYQTHGDVLGWYGLFNKDGYSFGAVDVMQECWTGEALPEEVMAPRIESRADMTMNGKTAEEIIRVEAGSDNTAKVVATTKTDATLTYRWFIFKDGDCAEDGSMPEGIEGLIPESTGSEISFKAPSEKGAGYRLTVYVLDDVNKKAASAVIPFYVE